jgi:hypothetical protein
VAGPLPARSKVRVGLDHGAQACLNIIVPTLNSVGNNPHEVFRRLDAGREYRISYLFTTEGQRQRITFRILMASHPAAKLPKRDDNYSSFPAEVFFGLLLY